MLRSSAWALAGALLLVTFPAVPAVAAGESTASCVMHSALGFSPGIGPAAQRVVSSSGGETGTIICTGTVRGHEVTGEGTMGFEGFFDISCLGGTGRETFSATIPTTGGLEKLSFVVDETVVPPGGFKVGGSLVGPAPYVFTPTRGDCVLAPITEVVFVGVAVVRS
ncbi:MAG: hypothetical protein ACRDKW_14200 [Actinomycetota bacterium]